eukprot:5728276-Pleurochrysis_carterae.AAC.1
MSTSTIVTVGCLRVARLKYRCAHNHFGAGTQTYVLALARERLFFTERRSHARSSADFFCLPFLLPFQRGSAQRRQAKKAGVKASREGKQ